MQRFHHFIRKNEILTLAQTLKQYDKAYENKYGDKILPIRTVLEDWAANLGKLQFVFKENEYLSK